MLDKTKQLRLNNKYSSNPNTTIGSLSERKKERITKGLITQDVVEWIGDPTWHITNDVSDDYIPQRAKHALRRGHRAHSAMEHLQLLDLDYGTVFCRT